MNCYSIYDASAEYFLPPYFARTDAEAKRMFIGSLGDSFQFRQDFNLFRLASFDQDTGIFTAEPAPIIVIAGATIPDESSYVQPVAELDTKEEIPQTM